MSCFVDARHLQIVFVSVKALKALYRCHNGLKLAATLNPSCLPPERWLIVSLATR